MEWFRHHGRDLPWRRTKDPYKIWVSEIILQQTQVVQGRAYYERFVDELPDVKSLAEVSDDKLLMLWQGLGYYSRAHNLKHAAQQIMEDYAGHFPQQEQDVRSLKGVGPYTTAAIMSIAFNYPLAVVDGNVYRVVSRLLATETPIDTTEGKKLYAQFADKLLDRENPSHYNQALMDLGAMICTPRNPLCAECPVQQLCQSKGTNLVDLLPLKAKRTQVIEKHLTFYLYLQESTFAVERRGKTGIWKGLYQLPLQVSDTPYSAPPLPDEGWNIIEEIRLPDHRLSHRLLHIHVIVCSPGTEKRLSTKYDWIKIEDHSKFAFPKPLRAFLDRYFKTPSPLFNALGRKQ